MNLRLLKLHPTLQHLAHDVSLKPTTRQPSLIPISTSQHLYCVQASLTLSLPNHAQLSHFLGLVWLSLHHPGKHLSSLDTPHRR
jgi:hypothetical protein